MLVTMIECQLELKNDWMAIVNVSLYRYQYFNCLISLMVLSFLGRLSSSLPIASIPKLLWSPFDYLRVRFENHQIRHVCPLIQHQ